MVLSANLEQVGPLLTDVRTRAGKKQSELAEVLRVSASRISRIEAGDLTPEPQEVQSYLEFLGTDSARDLLMLLSVEWRHMPRPSHSHPQLLALREAENCLGKIDAFVEAGDVPKTLLKQAALHRESLRRMAEYLSSLNHTAAYIGEIGAGKTTGICLQTGLILRGLDKNGIPLVALDTGSGRTTICEVRIRAGSGCGMLVFPAPDSEVHKLVGEFCEGIWATAKPQPTTHPDEPKGVSTEIDRAIRNMADLARTSRTSEAGKRTIVDPAALVARECASIEEFRSAVAERLKLWERTNREAWFEGSYGEKALEWLRKLFADINNGRAPSFGLPERIDVVLPFEVLTNSPYRVEIVDTRGVDQTVIRPDLRALLDDPRTVIVLASRFNNAPDPSLQELLKHLVTSRSDRAVKKAFLLVLARTEEVLATKDAATGQEADSEEMGYELKGIQVEDSLRRVGVGDVAFEFFNAKSDDPKKLSTAVLHRIEEMRAGYARRIDEISEAVDQMIANKEVVHALEAQREVNKVLLTFANQHRKLKSTGARVQDLLISAVREAYPRTVWATTRRAGSWGNLDVYHHLGVGASRISKTRTSKSFDALREHIRNKRGDREFAPTHRFLKELSAQVDDWEEEFLDAARNIGAETFRPGLEDATTLWDECAEIYGQGKKFRSEVADKIEEWFNNHPELQETFDRRLQAAWLENVLSPLRELCEGSVELGDSELTDRVKPVGAAAH
jgi:transcriptional regulator with XRE-family HTH domain